MSTERDREQASSDGPNLRTERPAPLNPLPRRIGSGAALERPFGWVFHIEGGLIREVRAYLTRNEALEAAGLSE